MPKVSVIIPVYNVEKYLRECLDSVINQTLRDIEIICVNDGSTDTSWFILKEYASRDPRIKVINQSNHGLPYARNRGLEIALGDYIYFLDSDDKIALYALEELYQTAYENSLDIIYFDSCPIFETEELEKTFNNFKKIAKRKREYKGIHTGLNLFVDMVENHDYSVSSCRQIFSNTYLQTINLSFYEGIIHEDNLFTFLSMIQASRVMHIWKEYFYRRIRTESIMTEKETFRNFEGYFVCYVNMLAFTITHRFEDRSNQAVLQTIKSIYGTAKRIYSKLPPAERKQKFSRNHSLITEFLYKEFIASMLYYSVPKDETKPVSADAIRACYFESELNNLRRTWSFRIGRIITFIPRKISGGILCCQEHGLLYTLFHTGNKFSVLKKKINQKRKNYLKKKTTDFDTAELAKMCSSTKKFGDNPLVSIIIPVYNSEEYLEKCVSSIRNQTLQNIEIILVDDGSTDKSLNMILEYAQQDRRIKVLCQKQQFAGVARNNGLEQAHGDYVIFLDSDDFFDLTLLENAYYAGHTSNADIVLFGAKRYDQVSNKVFDAPWLLKRNLIPAEQPFSCNDIPEYIFDIVTPCPWTKMFKRSFVLNNALKFQAIQNSNDVLFVLMALAIAEKIVAVDKDLVYYRVGSNGNIQTTKYKNPLNFFEAYAALKISLEERNIFKKFERSYVNMALSGCLYNLQTTLNKNAKKIVYNELKNHIFYDLGLTQYPEDYYFLNENYKKLSMIMSSSYEEYEKE